MRHNALGRGREVSGCDTAGSQDDVWLSHAPHRDWASLVAVWIPLPGIDHPAPAEPLTGSHSSPHAGAPTIRRNDHQGVRRHIRSGAVATNPASRAAIKSSPVSYPTNARPGATHPVAATNRRQVASTEPCKVNTQEMPAMVVPMVTAAPPTGRAPS